MVHKVRWESEQGVTNSSDLDCKDAVLKWWKALIMRYYVCSRDLWSKEDVPGFHCFLSSCKNRSRRVWNSGAKRFSEDRNFKRLDLPNKDHSRKMTCLHSSSTSRRESRLSLPQPNLSFANTFNLSIVSSSCSLLFASLSSLSAALARQISSFLISLSVFFLSCSRFCLL